VDYIKHIEIPKVHVLWAFDDVAQNIFHKLAVFFEKEAYRCHTGCFCLIVVRNVNGIDSLGHVGIDGRVLQLVQM
jgi:hypothetical protein